MVKLSDTVEYVSIYFVMGETPQGWTRNDIKDPPSNGWSNAFIIRQPGFLPKVFLSYTVQSWVVSPQCYELERFRDPIKPLNPVWMKDSIERAYLSRKGSGVPMDTEAAGLVIQSMGFEIPDMFKPEVAEKPVKEKKVKAKSGVREAREGLISVAQIAEELKILPRVARGYLRAAKIDKPEGVGWAGDAAWADMIREALKAEMSKEKPVKVKAAPKAKPEPVEKPKAKKAAPKPVKKAPAPKAKPAPAKKAAKKKAPVKKAAPKKKGVRK
jgi:hypothetical protein